MKAPAFQFYVKGWLGDQNVLGMGWDARGMHVHLLCIAWQEHPPCTLPDDDDLIQHWLGRPTNWEALKKQIFRAWILADGRWLQEGLFRTYEQQMAYRESRSKNAHAGHMHRRKNAYAHSVSASSSASVSATSPASTTSKKKKKGVQRDEATILAEFCAAEAYQGIDVKREWLKAGEWCKRNRRMLTERFFTNWLNRADKPLTANSNGSDEEWAPPAVLQSNEHIV